MKCLSCPSLKTHHKQRPQRRFRVGSIPRCSVYGIFTYVWLIFYGKCRCIYIYIPYMDGMVWDRNPYNATSKHFGMCQMIAPARYIGLLKPDFFKKCKCQDSKVAHEIWVTQNYPNNIESSCKSCSSLVQLIHTIPYPATAWLSGA